MNTDQPRALDRLEAASATIEGLAAEVGDRAARPDDDGASDARIGLVQQRLKVALDELAGADAQPLDVNDS
jgi:hypothetical protein